MRFRDEMIGQGLVYLSDPDQTVIRRYGLQDQTLGRDLARPATFILDDNGVIRWRHLPSDWRLRMGPQAYLAALKWVQSGEAGPRPDGGLTP